MLNRLKYVRVKDDHLFVGKYYRCIDVNDIIRIREILWLHTVVTKISSAQY